MKMRKKLTVCSLVFCLLAACADQGLGFGKSPPNEFLILTYPPLTVPPNISLRAPLGAGEVAPTSPAQRAAQTLYGQSAKPRRAMSAGEKELAQLLSLDKALPNIRKLIANERGVALYPPSLIKKIVPKQTPKK